MNAPKTQDDIDREAADKFTGTFGQGAFLAGVKYARESEAERVKGLVEALEAIIDPHGLPPIQENIGNRAVASIALARYRASRNSAGDRG